VGVAVGRIVAVGRGVSVKTTSWVCILSVSVEVASLLGVAKAVTGSGVSLRTCSTGSVVKKTPEQDVVSKTKRIEKKLMFEDLFMKPSQYLLCRF